MPIPWTASGRLLVAHLTDEEILDFIPADDFVLPNGTRLAPARFIAEVRQADIDGYFTFDSAVETFPIVSPRLSTRPTANVWRPCAW